MSADPGPAERVWAPDALLPPPGRPFAVLHRPGADRAAPVEILSGPVRRADDLDALGLDHPGPAAGEAGGAGTLVLTPYRQIRERGFAYPDDREPLLAMEVREHRRVPLDRLLDCLPDRAPRVEDPRYDVDDDGYAAAVDTIVDREIHGGEGSNFVLARSLHGRIRDFDRAAALSVLRGLVTAETGAYWTFLVFTGDRYLIGSTPEQQVRVRGDQVDMNPISGTYRYPRTGADLPGLLRFLRDPKETDELYMVVDEELKMMTSLCDRDVRVSGPSLKWMSRLAHTEYYLSGRSERPLTEILRTTMPAPTVTGSPVENACRVIERYEPQGRGYYSGVIALLGHESGQRRLDAAIMLRTADIGTDGAIRLTAGSTVVRESVPAHETAETTAKLSGLLDALSGGRTAKAPVRAPAAGLADVPPVHGALAARNDGLAAFWLGGTGPAKAVGAEVTIVDAEDGFTSMLAYQLRSLGCAVRLVPWYRAEEPAGSGGAFGARGVVLLGPGPGDPRDSANARVLALRAVAAERLAGGLPLAAVCLGHQVVCTLLGLPVAGLPDPAQGRRLRVPLWGRPRMAGFYNSFTARADDDWLRPPLSDSAVQVQRLGDEVIALRGPALATIQFHAESFLTEDGPGILADLLTGALAPAGADRAAVHESRGTHEHA
ncbi:Anthranilate synthase component 1 [Streptomyces sp. ADI92-24]|uniref:anthranilate synthase family protein n=1 Tax=unclassified Streptomyces TaxID=2593676 RepID=UPI000F46C81D|nr:MULTISPECIES: anthranilate synthase family protein [unclassified Streptomyces]MCX4774412.1 anthranilate synthase family protein [Streptomyces sp. NBC_01285]ROQ73110.1 phenazine biosynthesis protein phzE [Streptomyces sp. CEV 2-1]RPK35792.1 Anthranilate synthase component 1 [Streptomyces sp. ADI92-24]